MPTKLLLRRGLSTAVPNLDVGELGYDTDTATLRVGDGTTNPPRVYTNKTPSLGQLLPAVYWNAVLHAPTTLQGYGIVDAQPLNTTLTKISGINTLGQEGFLELSIDGNWKIVQLGSIESLTGILGVDQGGTGAATPTDAVTNLGAAAPYLANVFTLAQTISEANPTAYSLSLRSVSTLASVSPGISLERLASLPNNTEFAQIRFVTLDTSTHQQEAIRLAATVDNHTQGSFAAHMTVYAPGASGQTSVLQVGTQGVVTGSGNVAQGLGTVNASAYYMNNVSLSTLFQPVGASVSIANVTGLPDTLTGLLPTAGGTMTGPLYLERDPVFNTEAATKFYVDSRIGVYTATPPVGDIPPTSPLANQLWWNSLDGNLYIYYDSVWVSAFAMPGLYLGTGAGNPLPLQTYVTPPTPVPTTIPDAAVWNSGLMQGMGYMNLSVSVEFTNNGVLSVQRYVDQAGIVPQGTPITVTVIPEIASVLNVGDQIPFGSFTVSLANEDATDGTVTNFYILLNV